jgi:NADP-dependent 3-hydroxy acid dehydrogenase YdfG
LSQELNDVNITTICPGGINTPLWNSDNKYDGDVNDLLNTNDIIDTINYIINSNDNVVIKQITLFPKCEWH